MSFSDLKKNRGVDKLAAALDKLKGPNYEEQNKDYWYAQVDKAGNGFAIIRFLPAPEGEDTPFIRIFDHAFKSELTGKWYMELSRTSLEGETEDPVSAYNSKLWNTGNEDDKKTVRKRKRRLNYVSNIYVIKDPANPENEGKTFLFSYGKQVFDKINAAISPEFEGDEPMDPFDFWTGANFRLKIKNVEGYRNYNSSAFDPPGPLFADDDKMEALWKQEKPLKPLLDPARFKSYEELERRLKIVLGPELGEPEEAPRSSAPAKLKEMPAPAFTRQAQADADEDDADAVVEDDDDLSFFQKIADSAD